MTKSQFKLYQIAAQQFGFFTAKQAATSGYDPTNVNYHVENGDWEREHRGIYRLSSFPHTPYHQQILAYLWSCNRHEIAEGVISHESALDLYELSDIIPYKIHMTVPKKFRRSAGPPSYIRLHRENLSPDNVQFFSCFKVTTPQRTLLDIASESSVAIDHMAQAIHDAVQKGLVSKKFIQDHKEFEQLKSYIPEIFKNHAQ